MTIAATQTANTEIVLQERVATTEYRIVMIREFIDQRRVEVEVELGPFVTETRGPEDNPQVITIATGGRRGITVWENEEYDAIRDTWTNADLLAATAEKMS